MPRRDQVVRLDESSREISVYALDTRWRKEIDSATTEDALVVLAQKYMQLSQSVFVAQLPWVAPLPRLTGAGDVSLVTYRLRRLYCSEDLHVAHVKVVEQMLAFFDALSERIFDLRSQEEDPRQRLLANRRSAKG
jgi:hypothetical protein